MLQCLQYNYRRDWPDMRHRRHIVLNLNPFSQSLESQNKVTKSIVFAPKLQSVALKHVLCYRNARRRDARVVCASTPHKKSLWVPPA